MNYQVKSISKYIILIFIYCLFCNLQIFNKYLSFWFAKFIYFYYKINNT